MVALAFLALVPRWFLGFIATHWVWKSVESRDLIIKLFLAGPLGIGLSSLLAFVCVWAGLDLGLYVVLETAAAILFFTAVLWRERAVLAVLTRRPRFSLEAPGLIWPSLLVAAFLLYAAESWVSIVQYPHGGWDAWNHWNVVSRFIVRGGEQWTGTFLRTGGHPDYPLLVPFSNAVTWNLLGSETTRGPIALGFFFAVCLAGLLFGLLYKLRGPRQAALATIILLSHSYMAIWVSAQYVDTDLSFYFLASAGLMAIYFVDRQPALPVLAGFTAGLAAWTKNEGIPYAVLSALVWILASRLDRTIIRNFLGGLLFPLFLVGLFKVLLAPASEFVGTDRNVLALILDPARYRVVIETAVFTFRRMPGSPFVILVGLLVYALLIGRTKVATPGLLASVAIVVGQLATYFAVLLTTPYDPEWHVRGSIGRLYLQVAPLILLCLFLWLKSPEEQAALEGASYRYAAHN